MLSLVAVDLPSPSSLPAASMGAFAHAWNEGKIKMSLLIPFPDSAAIQHLYMQDNVFPTTLSFFIADEHSDL